MSNPLADMIGNFVLGLLDGAVKKWTQPYVDSGKIDAGDQAAIVSGVNADVKLGLAIEQSKPKP